MKEHVHMIGLNSIASIEIRMDFEKYVNADKTEKKQIVITPIQKRNLSQHRKSQLANPHQKPNLLPKL